MESPYIRLPDPAEGTDPATAADAATATTAAAPASLLLPSPTPVRLPLPSRHTSPVLVIDGASDIGTTFIATVRSAAPSIPITACVPTHTTLRPSEEAWLISQGVTIHPDSMRSYRFNGHKGRYLYYSQKRL